MKLDPGTIVDRYVVEEVLGAGGTALVYLVRHRSLGTRHALKVLTLTSSAIRDRMLREGQVQAALQHANVVSVTDVIDIDGQPGLLMEHVVGPSLERALNKYKLTMGDAEILFHGILAGVRAAHDMGLVHRDLKPANVLLQRTQAGFVPKVTDFGLAKLLESDPEVAHTRSGIAMGTPSYMAPEQVRDARSVDQRADLWSLGCLLYELMTRRRTFPGDEALAIYNAVTIGEFIPARDLVDGLPERVEQAIHGCLTVDRENRIPDCATLYAVLQGDKAWPLPAALKARPRGPVRARGVSMTSDIPEMAVATEQSAAVTGGGGGGGGGGAVEEVTAVPHLPPPIDPGGADEAETVLVSRASIDGTLFPSEASLDDADDGDTESTAWWVYLGAALGAAGLGLLLLFAFGAAVGSMVLSERASRSVDVEQPAPARPVPVPEPPAPVKPPAEPEIPVVPEPAPIDDAPEMPSGVPAADVPGPRTPRPKPAPAPLPEAAPEPIPVRVPVPASEPALPETSGRSVVKFFSQPAGADLWVGGYKRSRTPTPLQLESGAYEVQMQQRGGEVRSFTVEVEEGPEQRWCYVFESRQVVSGSCPAPAGGGATP